MKSSQLLRRWALALLLAVPLAVPSAFSAQEGEPPGQSKRESKLYIVQMADAPVVAYTGGVSGLRATRPNRGQKIDPTSPDVVRYAAFLTAKHDDALLRVGGARKAYSYKFSFNGFAAELSGGQADALRSLPGVLSVAKDELRDVDTSTTPAFLGLTGPNGVWQATGATGENVIIGIIDSGIWPEHPSFSDRTDVNGNGTKDGKLGYQQIPGWHGKCVPGEAFNAVHCNQKLIGARFYNEGFGGNAGIDATPAVRVHLAARLQRPRHAHGLDGRRQRRRAGDRRCAAFGSISGMAPRARIAVYKACWPGRHRQLLPRPTSWPPSTRRSPTAWT